MVAEEGKDLGGGGAFADLSTAQTIGGPKIFSTMPEASQDASGGTDLVRKSQLRRRAAEGETRSH
jgi:hypothetical protein